LKKKKIKTREKEEQEMKKKIVGMAMAVLMTVLSPLASLPQVSAAEDLKPVISGGAYTYEVEKGELAGGAFVDTGVPGFSGDGYVNIASGSVTLNVDVPIAGNYRVYLAGSTENNANSKWESVFVNSESEKWVRLEAVDFGTWAKCEIGNVAWVEGNPTAVPVTEGYAMAQGHNTVRIQANWGYAYYDQLILVPTAEESSKVIDVISLIDALPEKVQESNRYDINYAKKAYDALSAEQKAQVTNYAKLETALQALIQNPVMDGEKLVYEAEYSDFLGAGGYVGNTIAGYSGTGYAFVMTDGFEMKIRVPEAGKYRLMVVGANEGNGGRCEKVVVNQGAEYLVATPAKPEKTWIMSEVGTENWVNDELRPLPIEGGIDFVAGVNSVKILANWGYAAYDKIVLIPYASSSLGDINTIEKVNDLIAKLPEVITAGDIQSVEEVYALYNALSKADKAGVANAEKLIRARAAALALKADEKAPKGAMRFECEEGSLVGNTAVVNSTEIFPSYSGNGYVFLFDKEFSVDVYVAKSGYYDIAIVSGTTEDANKCDYVSVNGGEKLLVSTLGKKGVWRSSQPGTEFWENGVLKPQVPKGGFYLKEGRNTITISANWGYCAYDSIIVYPYGTAPNTGDHLFSMTAAGFSMLASAAVIGLAVVKRKREDYEVSNNQ